MPVRRAKASDVARIAEIHVRSWQAAYAGLIPQDYLDALDPAQRIAGWATTVEHTAADRGATLVVTDDEVTVGFAHVQECRDPDGNDESVGEVWAIYLDPQGWGKGLGRELITAAEACLARLGYEQATLWVLDSNARARRFYEAAGFRPDGAAKIDGQRGFELREIRYRKALGSPAAPDLRP